MSYYDFTNNGTVPQYQIPYPIPQQVPQRTVSTNDTKFTWIYGGSKSAKAYPQAPNMTGYYRDTQEPYLFEKTTDNYGKVINFKIYKLIEEQEPETEQAAPQPIANVVSKDEFDNFSKNVDTSFNELKEMILSMNKPYNKPYNQKKGQVNNNAQ